MPDINEAIHAASEPERRPVIQHSIEERVSRLFAANVRRLTRALGATPDAMAREFMNLLEQRADDEQARSIAKGEKVRTIDPYADRVLQYAIRFLGFTPAEQETVITGMRDGIPWRGDDMAFYLRVVEETEAMREMGVAAYRQRALGMLRGAMR